MINVNSELISDYLMIQANGTILGNFKYGKINHWKSTPSSQLKRCNINVNFVKLDGRQSKTNDMSFYNIVSRFGGDDITRYRNLFGVNGFVRLENILGSNPYIEVKRPYDTWAVSKFSKLKSLAQEITDVTTISLLNQNILSFHGGAFAHDTKGYVITGLPDMGKTYTTLKLLENKDIEYMSEDIVLIDDGFVISVPFTQTVEKRREIGVGERLLSKINDLTMKQNYIKTDIFTFKPEMENRHRSRAKLDTIFFLTRNINAGVKRLSGDEKKKYLTKAIQLNNLEFEYSRNLLIVAYLFYNSERKIEDFLQKESELITSMFEKATVYEVAGNSHEDYWRQISDILV